MSPFFTVISTVFCSLLVGLLVHYLTKDRDARTREVILEREADLRRRVFRKQVLLCRYSLERTPGNNNDKVWEAYTPTVPNLLADAALVEGDFADSPEFTRLVRRAGEWRRDEAIVEAERFNPMRTLRDVLRDSLVDVDTFIQQEIGRQQKR